jgi:hypothetical protein
VLYLQVPKAPEPVVVFLTRKPPERLPQRVRLAGLFYKLVTLPEDPEAGDRSVTHLYPVIVAKTVHGASSGGGPWPASLSLFFGVVVILLLIFAMLRRHGGRRLPGGAPTYRPTYAEEEFGQPPPTAGEQADTEEIDEELRRQVEAYRAERRQAGEDEDAEETNNSG